ncbi:MAG: CHASE domain-containing protein, partial [bacterium]
MSVLSDHPGVSPGGVRPFLWAAFATLIIGLLLTVTAALLAKSRAEAFIEKEFIFSCDDVKARIAERLADHARILRNGSAFFAASETVTRQMWRRFTEQQQMEHYLPGIQGLGFAFLIPRDKLDEHQRTIRSEGFPDYRVWPEGDRSFYSSIIYLEPFTDRNLRAFGYDMLNEPVRRAAMESARDMDIAALSGKVVLVQETGKDVQAGTLMYVPVYRNGQPAGTVDERRAALVGWVYSPYRMNDLLRGILGDAGRQNAEYRHLQVYDGEQISPASLLYDSHPAWTTQPRFTRQSVIDFGMHRWTLRFIMCGGPAVEY